MTSIGVHFALSPDDEKRLLDAAGDSDEVLAIIEEIEGREPPELYCDDDKAWDAIHRSLTDGRLEYANGSYPLRLAVLGGRQLVDSEDLTVAYVTAAEVRDVAEALNTIEEPWFREHYFALDPDDYGPDFGEDDFEYSWDGLQDLREFFDQAAAEGKAVIFTVDA